MAKIIAIDDEEGILKVLKTGLEKEGHIVTTYSSAKDIGYDQLRNYDLMLLDVMMPEVDGFTFCKQIRMMVDYPIIFLTAKDMEEDITNGLYIGADDYLIKPFRIAELRARVNAHLRRDQREKRHRLVFGACEFDLDAKSISINGKQMQLTKSEYLICELLARHRGQALSKEQIYEDVFSFDGESDNSTIATHVKNIRAKFEEFDQHPISTVWGIGYKWD